MAPGGGGGDSGAVVTGGGGGRTGQERQRERERKMRRHEGGTRRRIGRDTDTEIIFFNTTYHIICPAIYKKMGGIINKIAIISPKRIFIIAPC